MKVLIVGYGSIGRRHYEVLSSLHIVNTIDIVTKQTLAKKKTFKTLEDVISLEKYDYYVIASETNRHYKQLDYLESKLKDKIFFCEKPLFGTKEELIIRNNEVYVGYVLRFHPLMAKLKSFVEEETIISIHVTTGQYLPTWRPQRDYRETYSAHKDQGGGVLLDLSHEIDYLQWLGGKVEEIKSYQRTVSDLEIDSDDLTTFIGRTTNGIVVNVSMDYISKIPFRSMLLHTFEHTYHLDLIKNELLRKDKQGHEEAFDCKDMERNTMFEKMHRAIISRRQMACTYAEALDVMQTIATIQEQNT